MNNKMKNFKEQPKKTFFRKFWWAGLIALIILGIGIGYTVMYVDLRIVDSFTDKMGNAFQYNTPTIMDDSIYIGTSSNFNYSERSQAVLENIPHGTFYKMDLDLNPIWSYSLGKSNVAGSASLDSDGNIYFVAISYALNTTRNAEKGYNAAYDLYSLTNDGELRWKTPISEENVRWIHGMINCAISSDDTIYVGESRLFAFDSNGSIKWQYPDARQEIKGSSLGQKDNAPKESKGSNQSITGFKSSPIIDSEGNVYFVSPEPTEKGEETDQIRIYKFTSDSKGTPVWSTLLDNQTLDPPGGKTEGGGMKERWMLSSPAFSKGEKFIYSAVGNTINKIDCSSGEIVWSMKPEGATGAFKASPVVDDQDNIYIGSKSNNESNFYAIKADGSGLLWVRHNRTDIYTTAILGDDGLVYYGSEGSYGSFHAVDMKTGQEKWGIGNALQDFSYGSPVLNKGFVYFGGYMLKMPYKSMYKLKVDAFDYLPDAAWPKIFGQ